eukprot:420834_1
MGTNFSKGKKNKLCNCALYYNYSHCCMHECFTKIKNVDKIIAKPCVHDEEAWSFTEEHQQSMTTAISNLKLKIPEDIISTIHLYLPPTLSGHFVHCHGAMTDYIETNGLCE